MKPLKDKKAKRVLKGFIKIEREFHNTSMHKWLDDNDILKYSTHYEGMPVVADKFIRTLKGKIYKKNDS